MAGGLGNVLTDFLRFINAGADTTRVLVLKTEGTNGATHMLYVGNRDPNGAITGNPGDSYFRIDGANSAAYLHTGTVPSNSDWNPGMGAGSGNVVGPGSADDEALTRFDGLTGEQIQNGQIKENDAGALRDWVYEVISPAAIAAPQDDYAPTGWDDAELVRLSLTGDQTISGFGAVTANAGVPQKVLINTSATDALLILNDDGGSVAANRVLTPGDAGLEYRLDPGEAAVLLYDYASSRWRVQTRDSRTHITDFNVVTETTPAIYNDYSPAGWSKADVLFYNDGADLGDTYFNGFEAGVVQKRKHIINLDGGPIHLLHLDSGSILANQIICPRGVNVVLEQYESAMLLYTGSKWSVIAVSEQETLQSVIDPFAAQQDDYSPPNWATLDILVANPTGAQTITGFEQILSHQFKMIVNSSGTDGPLTLASEHAGSTIGNRIRTMDDNDLVLQKGDVAIIAYDQSIGRWRVIAPTQPDAVYALTDALAADQNDYAPFPWFHVDLLRLTMAANRTITGFARLNSHNHKTLVNGGPGVLSLTHQDGLSAAGNQIRTPTGATLMVRAGYGVELYYDSTTLYWYVVRQDIDPASTTEVLTGTATDRTVTPDALAALWEKGANVASAATVSLGEGGFFHITGVTTITDIDFTTPKDGRLANVIFDGVLTLTHSATLQLPGGANILTAAGDRATFVQDAGDTVICTDYQRAAQLYGAPTKEVFFGTGATNAARGDYPVLNLGSGGSGDFGFYVPHDFVSLVSIVLVAIPGGTVGAANIDLLSDYGSAAAAQQFNNHSESNAVITYALTAGQLTELDVSSVFSLLAALDYAGFHINHTGVTGGVDYLGIRLRYQ
jgi:hypothetical protein